MATRRQDASEAGGSMVEFAIVAPVLIALVMFGTYFQDAVRVKLKNQEAARFAVWEFTAFPLSNYADQNHPRFFDLAKKAIAVDVNDIYKDFDSAESSAPTTTFVAQHTLDTSLLVLNDLDVPLKSTKSLNKIPGFGAAASSLLGAVNGGLDKFGPPAFGFNMKGMVEVQVKSTFQNKLLPNKFFGKFEYGQIDRFQMVDSMYLVADGWTLHDGRDVVPDPSQTGASLIEASGPEHPFASEVDRMSFLGLKDKLLPNNAQAALGTVQRMLGAFGIPLADPLFLNGAPVASVNYRRLAGPAYTSRCSESANNPALQGKIDLEQTGRKVDIGQNCFHTIPYRVTFAYNNSPEVKVFKMSNRFYLGCKTTEAQNTLLCH